MSIHPQGTDLAVLDSRLECLFSIYHPVEQGSGVIENMHSKMDRIRVSV